MRVENEYFFIEKILDEKIRGLVYSENDLISAHQQFIMILHKYKNVVIPILEGIFIYDYEDDTCINDDDYNFIIKFYRDRENFRNLMDES